MMADPVEVGRKLARKVGKTKPVLTPDPGTALGIAGNRHFPVQMGRFLARMAERAKERAELDADHLKAPKAGTPP
jgi:hypothetical protein